MESPTSIKEDAVVVEIPPEQSAASEENGDSKDPSMVEQLTVQSQTALLVAAAAAANASSQPINPNQNPNSNTNQNQNQNPIQSPSSSSISAQITNPSQIPAPAQEKPPTSPTLRRRVPAQSAYVKPKSRIIEPPYPSTSKIPAEEPAQNIPPPESPIHIASTVPGASPRRSPKTSTPITPRTPLMAAVGGGDGDAADADDDDDDVFKVETVAKVVKKGKNMKWIDVIEWIAFLSMLVVLIASLTIGEVNRVKIWKLELWKWTVFVMVIFCGRLLTRWTTNTLVFLIERNFLFKKKVLYFVFALKKSFRVVLWLGLILLSWALLINRGVERTEETSEVLNYITRGIVATLVGAVLWMAKTLLVKIVASTFHVRTYFDRIQESLFHQYILQALSGPPLQAKSAESSRLSSGKLSFRKVNAGTVKDEDIDVDKLYRMDREKVSAWTMGGLIGVIRNSKLSTVYDVIDEAEEESKEPQVITSEAEARDAAYRIFRNVAKHGHKYIDEEDLLRFMQKEEVDNAIPLFEGAAEMRRIKKSAFRNWVVKAYNERKCLALSLSDAKTAVEELNKLSSGLILVVIVIVWLLLMEITTTRVLIFISSQVLLVVFMFGNTVKTVFEAIIFVFIVHPFDVGDRCVVDGTQLIVDEMNILTTVFLKPDNEKVYYPNTVLSTKAISNFMRSPEQMGDSVEFAVDFSTSVENIAALKTKVKEYLESKPKQWNPSHSVQVKDIVDVDKMIMALYVTHTINFQNAAEKGNRRSDLVLELKKILEELGIRYHLLPQEMRINYAGETPKPPL